MVFPHPGGDERDQGQAEEKEQVGPQDVAVHPLDGVQQVVVVVPVDADEGEAEQVAQEHGDQRPERGQVRPRWYLELQHHDGDDDGDHAVAERFETPLAHSDSPRTLPVQLPLQVLQPGVADDGDHAPAGAQLFRPLQGHPDVRSGGDAAEDPLLAGQPAPGGQGVLVAHGHDLVREVQPADGRHEAGAHPFETVPPVRSLAGQGPGILGFDGDAAHPGDLPLVNLGVAGEAATRADPHHELVEPAVELREDLAGHGRVACPVVRVVELVGPEGVGLDDELSHPPQAGLNQLRRHLPVDARDELHHGPEGPHGLQLLLGERVRGDEVGPVPLRRAHHGERAARAAAGVVDDAPAGAAPDAPPSTQTTDVRSAMLPPYGVTPDAGHETLPLKHETTYAGSATLPPYVVTSYAGHVTLPLQHETMYAGSATLPPYVVTSYAGHMTLPLKHETMYVGSVTLPPYVVTSYTGHVTLPLKHEMMYTGSVTLPPYGEASRAGSASASRLLSRRRRAGGLVGP